MKFHVKFYKKWRCWSSDEIANGRRDIMKSRETTTFKAPGVERRLTRQNKLNSILNFAGRLRRHIWQGVDYSWFINAAQSCTISRYIVVWVNCSCDIMWWILYIWVNTQIAPQIDIDLPSMRRFCFRSMYNRCRSGVFAIWVQWRPSLATLCIIVMLFGVKKRWWNSR